MDLSIPESVRTDAGDSSRATGTGDFPPVDRRDALTELAGESGGDATRHLCAAAHLDRHFRNRAIQELVENQHRVPAASPGVDLARVLGECLRVRRDAVIAGLAVIAVGVLGLVLARAETVAAVALVLVVRALSWLVGVIFSALAAQASAANRGRRASAGGAVMTALFVGIIAALYSLLQVFRQTASTTASFGGSSQTQFGDSTASSGASAFQPYNVLIILIIWVAIGAARRYRNHLQLAALHRPENASAVMADPGRPESRLSRISRFAHLASLFHDLRTRPTEAETLYSDYQPFIGAGISLTEEAWSFPVELLPNSQRRDSGEAPDVIPLPALHQSIMDRLTDLSSGQLYPGDVLRQLEVRDRVFRTGMRSAADQKAGYGTISAEDPGTGVQTVRPDYARLLDYASHELIRHYLEARVVLWKGQIVASVFIRAYIQGGLLQVEGIPFLLPPIAKRYRVVDGILPPELLTDGGTALWQALRSFALDIATSVIEPWGAFRSVVRARARKRWYRRMRNAKFAVNHAPRVSLRELGSEPVYQQLFQELDAYRFFTCVRERAINAVLGELRAAGYATSEFEQMAQTVNQKFNYGTENNASNGASINVLGQQGGAKASMSQVTRP